MKENKTHYKLLLKTLRETQVRFNISANEISDIIGITKGFMSHLYGGTKGPSETTLNKIKKAIIVINNNRKLPLIRDVFEDLESFRNRRKKMVELLKSKMKQ